jgi:hypothetical protein
MRHLLDAHALIFALDDPSKLGKEAVAVLEHPDSLLTAVENGGAGSVSRRSKMAAHNRAGIWEGRIGATAPITPPFRERHRSALRHGDLERDTA